MTYTFQWGEALRHLPYLLEGAWLSLALAFLGFWGGALISATLFGLAHGVNVVWTVNAAALGLAAAWAYHRSGSLWPAAVAHMAYNLVAVAAIHGAVSAG